VVFTCPFCGETNACNHVPGSGPHNSAVMLIGEGPGRDEYSFRRPFVGKTGDELATYLAACNLHPSQFYLTNVDKEYRGQDIKPTAADIAFWSPVLIDEIERCHPRLIVAIGAYSVKWFLGPDVDLETVHGIPHRVGSFGPTELHDHSLADSLIIIPTYHPAAPFYKASTKSGLDYRTLLQWDFRQAADTLKLIRAGQPINFRVDPYHDDGLTPAICIDVTGTELAEILAEPSARNCGYIGLDTEGTPEIPWSLQLCFEDGVAYVLRVSQSDLQVGLAALQQYLLTSGVLVVMHQASTPRGTCYDIQVCRTMGLELNDPRITIWDTMYAAYLLRYESQALKRLSYRRFGARLTDYTDLIKGVARPRQLEYLQLALSLRAQWTKKPHPISKRENDGTITTTQPKSIASRIDSILKDIAADKRDKDDNPVDLESRWEDIYPHVREEVELELGEFPKASLDDLPLQAAADYAGKDAIYTRALYPSLLAELASLGLADRMTTDMEMLKIDEKCQRRGMIASRKYFLELRDTLQADIDNLGRQMSEHYFDGQPFNPKSSLQVSIVMDENDIIGLELTKAGKSSTSKKSIEHLRTSNEFISMLFDWRERAHNRDMFAEPVLELIPESDDLWPIRTNIKTTRTTARRRASFNPNWLATPTRTELGKQIRNGYQAREGMVFTSHDLSQIEARCLAHESLDPLLLRFFINGNDIHIETAARLSGIKVEDVSTEERRAFKTVNYLIIYGGGGEALQTQLRMLKPPIFKTVEWCDDALKEWFKLYKGVADYRDGVVREARRLGYVRDHSGMYRYLPALNSRDYKARLEAERHAVSHKVQGLAQTMIQNSMRWIDANLIEPAAMGAFEGLGPLDSHGRPGNPEVYWLLQIHDEVMLEIDDSDSTWELVDAMIVEGLTQHSGVRLRVPVLADGHRAKRWGELKD
jgi:uracil-DNA glycosylase family 4